MDFYEHSILNLGILLMHTHLFGHMEALVLRGVAQTQAS